MSATPAALGITEIVLIAMAALMLVGVPVAVLVVLWIVQRGKQAPPAVQQPQGTDDRHTTLIDIS